MYREVIEQERFTYDLDLYRNLYPRMDEVHDAITWTLSRNPRVGQPLADFPDFWVFKTTGSYALPAFRVLYEFTGEAVILHAINAEL
jgi:hypothetical protein